MAIKYNNIIHEWFEEVWNQRKTDVIDRLFATNEIAYGISNKTGTDIRGPEEFKQFHAAFLNAFPDIHLEVLDSISEGDKFAGRCLVSGTHTGYGLGFNATGKSIQFSGICIVRMKDGQIVEAWNSFDFMRIYQQLGCPVEMLSAN